MMFKHEWLGDTGGSAELAPNIRCGVSRYFYCSKLLSIHVNLRRIFYLTLPFYAARGCAINYVNC